MMSLGPRPVLSPGKEVGVWAENAGGHDVITGQRLGSSIYHTIAVSGANLRAQGAPAAVWFRQVPARRTLTIRQVHRVCGSSGSAWSRGQDCQTHAFMALVILIYSCSFAAATRTRAAGWT